MSNLPKASNGKPRSKKKAVTKSGSNKKGTRSTSHICADNFEKICFEIVEKILGNSLEKITKTNKTKDGGYDIDTMIRYNSKQYAVLFECKLREKKVNLRDIAANVIIAYNKCTDSLVIMTNNTFTPQLEKELCRFRDSSHLNIKVVIGEGIESVVNVYEVSIDDKLLDLLKKEKSNKNIIRNSSLILNLNSEDVCGQIIKKSMSKSDNKEADFMAEMYPDDIERALLWIKNNKSFVVNGYIGTGKSAFITKILDTVDRQCIRLNAEVLMSQELVIINLIRKIWGLPDNINIDEFKADEVKYIMDSIGNDLPKKTRRSLECILNNAAIPEEIEENSILCKYLVLQMERHRAKTKYIVYFDNFHAANQEVGNLFVYLINLFSAIKIPCIIETDEIEYNSQKNNSEALEKIRIPNVIEITPFTKEQAETWFKKELNVDDEAVARLVQYTGERLYCMSYVSQKIRQKYDKPRFEDVMEYLKKQTAFTMPEIISEIVRSFMQTHEKLFYLLRMLNGRVPVDMCMNLKYAQLLKAGIITCDEGYINASNEIVKKLVNNEMSSPVKEMEVANQIIEFCGENPGKYKEAKIYGLFYAKRGKEAIRDIDLLINELGQKRNFVQTLDLIDLAISIARKEQNYNSLANYLIKKLEVNAAIKSLSFDNARATLSGLKEVADSGELNASSEALAELALCHFNGVIALRDCKFQDAILNEHIKYYNNCLNGTMRENPGDYLGKVCWNYALYIKETQGNSAALKVFEAASEALPNSHMLRIGYLSHLACILLPSDPQKSYEYYCEIIELVNNGQTFCDFPFHEYGDKAMCKVLLKEADKALAHAKVGIRYAESHGVFDEVGRILNIKGCAYLLSNNILKAVKCFREATEIMEYSGYNLYRWRSEMNYVNYSLTASNTVSNKEELRNKLLGAYSIFKDALMKKVLNLISSDDDFLASREFLALLVVGKCSRQLFDTKENIISAEKVAEELCFPDKIKEHYLEMIEQLTDPQKKLTLQSLYVHNGNIFIIG